MAPKLHHTSYMYMEKILPGRMSMTACSFASHFGQDMAQNADLPIISCKNFSGVTPPNPRPVLGHRAVLFPDFRCFGSHNFQIVPVRLFVYFVCGLSPPKLRVVQQQIFPRRCVRTILHYMCWILCL